MLTLANDHVRLTLEPQFGARVTALTDIITGRQWLVEGGFVSDVGEDAAYGAGHARGWDECFPTVGVCNHAGWGGRLRDHGMLWGRTWDVVAWQPDQVETQFSGSGFAFTRTLTLNANAITADYAATNLGNITLPYLWSQHCLLATTPQDKIALSGHSKMMAKGITYDWPAHPLRDLTEIGPITDGFALKSYAATPGPASAAITNPHGGIRFDWTDVPAFGLWLSYGGWPEGAGIHQIALEPTTAAADDLSGAEALGQARVLAPQETHRWQVKITLTGPKMRASQ